MLWTHRTDRDTSDAIGLAVMLDAEEGGIAAWRFLQTRGLSMELIERVLLEPSRRRACDMQRLRAVRGEQEGFHLNHV